VAKTGDPFLNWVKAEFHQEDGASASADYENAFRYVQGQQGAQLRTRRIIPKHQQSEPEPYGKNSRILAKS
jgi:hypothetical protein